MKELLLTYIAIEEYREAYEYLTSEYVWTRHHLLRAMRSRD